MTPQKDKGLFHDQRCKICQTKVNKKTGVQCQGACQSWVHFKCLNYTPGKIKDILNGLIEVACPCPDCKTTETREFLTAKAVSGNFTCNNLECPANQRGHECENFSSPSNKKKDGKKAKHAGGWPVIPCGKGVCIKNKAFNLFGRSVVIPALPASASLQKDQDPPKPGRDSSLTKKEAVELCNVVEELTGQISDMIDKLGGKSKKGKRS